MDVAAAADRGVAVDLHGLSVLDARKLVLATLKCSPPRAVVRFISGLGLHSAGGVSAIKTDLERCFDAWKLRWRWEHGTFTVVTSDTPARIGRTDGWTDRRSESQSRPQVTMASKAELALWLNTSAARAWTHGSGGADLTAPESFPALGSSTLSKDRKKSETSVWRQSSKPRKRAPDAKVPRKQPQPQAPNQEGLTSELVAQYQQWRRRQPQQQHPGDVAGGAAAATVGLVRQLSNSCRRATVSAEVELVAAEAQIDRDTAELDMVREQAVDELVSWGFERDAVLAALAACGWSIGRAADALLG